MKMNFYKKLVTFLIVGLSINAAVAQDIHLTQYNEAPMLLNPANAGFFKGQYRVMGNFRNQWNYRFINNNNIGATNTGYKTVATSFDFSVSVTKKSADKLGLGLLLYNDRAGEVALSTTSAMIAVSYWKSLEAFKNKYIVFGLMTGFVQRHIDYTNLQLPDQYNHIDPLHPLAAISYPVNQQYLYPDISVGVKYFAAISKRKFLQFGGSIYHINKPKNSFFFDSTTDRTYRKVMINGGMKLPISFKFDLLPSILIMGQGPALEINEGAFARFQITEMRSKDLMAYNFGMWFRQSKKEKGAYFDAINFVTKLEFNQYTVGFSYDVNVSKLNTSTRLKGGPELSISFVGNLDAALGNKKRPVCPVF